MGSVRPPFIGAWNVIRFNWHLYAFSGALALAVYLTSMKFEGALRTTGYGLCFIILATTVVSLVVSFYVYDLSGLYRLNWLDDLGVEANGTIVNVNAGFDETSILLSEKYPKASLLVFDFYDSDKHTEVSIERARRAYPPYPGTRQTSTSRLPLQDASADCIFVILAAHEIRDDNERISFFRELRRGLAPTGRIVVTEHLRDLPNLLAYSIGILHFLPGSSWHKTFGGAGLTISKTLKINPFITTYLLRENGITP